MDNRIVYCCVFVTFLCVVNAIITKDCGSVGSKVKTVAVSGCATTPTCNLPKGQNATFTVEFTTTETFSKATAVVHGMIAGVPVPFPIAHPDGCTESGLSCPVKANTDNTYKQSIFVEQSYPMMKLVVKWELKDENTKDIFCIELPVQIVDGPKKNRGENDVL